MKTGTKRQQRVEDLIRAEVAEILMTRVRDPRIGFVTVTSVQTSADLRYAKIYVSVLRNPDGPDQTAEKDLEGLRKASSFIRSELGRRIELKFLPELEFYLDRSAEEAARVIRLIDELQGGKSDGS